MNSPKAAIFFDATFYKIVFFLTLLLIVISYNSFCLAANIIYFICIAAKLKIFTAKKKIEHSSQQRIKKNFAYKYTIVLPVYMEANIIEVLLTNIKAMKYDTTLLQVLIVLEEDDIETRKVVEKLSLPENYEVIIVPTGLPKTKARACNYALQYATGDILAIYDAEDKPDPEQLLKVAAIFKAADARLACVQCKLQYYNAEENWLTQMFAIEYDILFGHILPALNYLELPIPLGGSSNHFKTDILRKIGAWDEYNVTEDADLGLRLKHAGYSVTISDSVTMEEAPITYWAWIKQRARWIKGHIQTYFVYTNLAAKNTSHTKFQDFLFVQYFLGAANLTLLACPAAFIICYIADVGLYLQCFAALNGMLAIFSNAYFAYSVLKDRRWRCVTFPVYFLLHATAAARAVIELCRRPFYWDKTKHGISLAIKK